MKTVYCVLLGLVLLLSGFTADKGKEKSVSLEERPALLVDREWELTNIEAAAADADAPANVFALLPANMQDDCLRFAKNGTFAEHESAAKHVKTGSGTWQLRNENSQLILVSGHGVQVYEIQHMSTVELRLQYQVLEKGHSYTVLTTLRRK